MAQRFRRRLDTAPKLQPGEWCADHVAVLRCVGCGGYIHLSPARVIARDGSVGQRVRCETETCTFVDFIVLDDFGMDVE